MRRIFENQTITQMRLKHQIKKVTSASDRVKKSLQKTQSSISEVREHEQTVDAKFRERIEKLGGRKTIA
jgi:phage shock protein A